MTAASFPAPTRKLLLYLAVPLVVMVLGVYFFPLMIFAVSLDICLLGLAFLDYRQARRSFKVSYELSGTNFFSIGKKNTLTLSLYNQGPRNLEIELNADIPDSWEVAAQPQRIILKTGDRQEHHLAYRPMRRGVFHLEDIYYRVASSNGFIKIYGKWNVHREIEVFPDIKEVNRYMLMSRRNRLSGVGINKNRYRGMGTNLEYLREYVEDDDSRRIDWKASTRGNKLVCKEYQMESNHQIALVLDCGRVMTAEQGGMNSLDHAVNAALMLSYIASKAGDSVTVFAFSDRIIGELPPVKGKNMMNKILTFTTRLQPDFVESNYQQVFEHLRVRLKRRALIVFFSDIIDDINYKEFYKYLTLLSRKHLPLIILLRDELLMENSDIEPRQIEDVFLGAAAADMYMRRADVIRKLKQRRINLLDLLPHEVTPSLIRKYLEMKSRNMI